MIQPHNIRSNVSIFCSNEAYQFKLNTTKVYTEVETKKPTVLQVCGICMA